jgi:DNA polymerase V
MTALNLYLSPVPAGFPSPAENFIDKKLDLNEHLIAHPAATFFVRVEGYSMIDANIHEGDVLIIDRSLSAEEGCIALVLLNGEFTVKRLSMRQGKVFLIPENPRFMPIEVSAESDFQVWGIVTYIIHKAHVRSRRL